MTDGQFYETKDDRGKRLMFNVNNVALMAVDVFGTKVTLNVKDKEGNYIEFISTEDFKSMTQNVKYQDIAQGHNQENRED